LVQHGVTGYLCNSEADYLSALTNAHFLSRFACRESAAERFDSEIMRSNYERLYRLARDQFSAAAAG
ncbi:MAG: hypothetical protein KDD44_03030, partial [Bdellovibrionales bacterium]|nr:hypothetical protein [Bdellovibrionales bacterium]